MPIIHCGYRLSEKAGRSVTMTSRCVHPPQSRMPRFHPDGQFNLTHRRPRSHSTVRRNTVRRHRDSRNTVHRSTRRGPGHRLNTVLCKPSQHRPAHRCRFILRAFRHRKKMISIFSPVHRGRMAPRPPRGQAPRRRRIHRMAIRRQTLRRATLRQITRGKMMCHRTTHHVPSRPERSNKFHSARAHRSSPGRLDRLK